MKVSFVKDPLLLEMSCLFPLHSKQPNFLMQYIFLFLALALIWIYSMFIQQDLLHYGFMNLHTYL